MTEEQIQKNELKMMIMIPRKDNQSSIPMVVKVSKTGGPCLEFGVTAYADEIVIDSLSVKDPDMAEDQLPYEGPRFDSLAAFSDQKEVATGQQHENMGRFGLSRVQHIFSTWGYFWKNLWVLKHIVSWFSVGNFGLLHPEGLGVFLIWSCTEVIGGHNLRIFLKFEGEARCWNTTNGFATYNRI